MPVRLQAALHLHAVLPALAVLAPRDPAFAGILAGPDTAVTLRVPGLEPTRVERSAGRLTVHHRSCPGGLLLHFPTAGQFVRATARLPALALPVAGIAGLPTARRLLESAGQRLEAVLTDRDAVRRDDTFARLHVPAALTVAVAGGAVWLRRHPDGPALHARFEGRLVRFTAVDPEFSVWLDLAPRIPAWGVGPAPRAADADVRFADLPTAVGELLHENDSLAALGHGRLQIRGHLPLAEQIGLVMQKVDRILQPAPRKTA
ncbi:MAG: hypothetical protein ABII82_09515 [Verrucomicrobiota bacterium]